MEDELREKLQKKLDDYITHTFRDVETVNKFCDKSSRWISERKTELPHLREINTKVKNMNQDDSRRKDLEKELGEVLKDTVEGLKKLHYFLDAVEKLAVTSLFVFMDENFRPHGASHISVISLISTARIVSPLLLHFKRDAGAFFLPILNNMETLEFQLNQYILITQQICELMENGSRILSDAITRQMNVSERKHDQISLKKENVECVEKQSEHLLQLINIRKDEKFRMCFLFNDKAEDFISLFSDCGPRMFKFLSELEKAAVQLDKMKKGSHISTVAGSSVGIAGGGLSIAGLALAPFTAGLSLAFTIAGAGLGVTSGVNSIVTNITEMAVNNHHEKKANNIFTSFMEDVQKILDCKEEAVGTELPIEGPDFVTTAFNVGKIVVSAITVRNGIIDFVAAAQAVKVLRSKEVIAKAVNAGLQEANAGRSIPKLASDLPDIGQLAKGTPLALKKTVRAAYIGVNALFIGVDAYCIIKSSICLSKGSKNETAQVIRDRSVLWRSEVEAWEKIHHHLCKGISGFRKNLEILEKPFNI